MNTKLNYLLLFTLGISAGSASGQSNLKAGNKNYNAADFFAVNLQKGERLANIYSCTIAYAGDSIKTEVYRVSGSSTYELTDHVADRFVFKETDLYDGHPESTGTSAISLSGKGSYNGKEFENTSASGLFYSELVWGAIPKQIHEGYSWKVTLTKPWELGGPGVQTVTVISIDKLHNTVTLKREGDSEGFYTGDLKQLLITTTSGQKVKVDVAPGHSHWVGYTIIKNGVILSDELLVTRPVTLSADSHKYTASQREYILLNAMPYSM